MTQKEKYLQKLAGKKSNAVRHAEWRNTNREWLVESQKLAMKIVVELERQKMTQKELAVTIGKSPQYVNKLLSGNEKFGFEILVKIQNALNLGLLSSYKPKKSAKIIQFTMQTEVNQTEFQYRSADSQFKITSTHKNLLLKERSDEEAQLYANQI